LPQILPFAGIRYDAESPALDKLVAPPYDVLSKEQVIEMHASDAHNIAHLTRPLSYGTAAELWTEWRSDGTLVQDAPALYLYQQTFVDPETGALRSPRTGLIVALELEEYGTGAVLPHENTIAAHRADRLELMRTTHANLESIYGLYADSTGAAVPLLNKLAAELPVIARLEGAYGSSHSLRAITDPSAIAALQKAVVASSILIADGHHRYETALAYRRERPDEPGSGAILLTLTAFEDKGLLVLPTHRLIRNVAAGVLESLPAKLKEIGFDVSAIDGDAPELAPGTQGFDLLLGDGSLHRAVLAHGVDPAAKIDGPQSAAWKSLDVSILHKLVLEDLVDIPMSSLAGTDKVRYTRDAIEAQEKVASGEFQAAFLLSRPTLDGIRAVSQTGDRMPQKSTFFYPKLLSGLVMRDLTH
jgi:uncharacterized protein (DUF1015 family)